MKTAHEHASTSLFVVLLLTTVFADYGKAQVVFGHGSRRNLGMLSFYDSSPSSSSSTGNNENENEKEKGGKDTTSRTN